MTVFSRLTQLSNENFTPTKKAIEITGLSAKGAIISEKSSTSIDGKQQSIIPLNGLFELAVFNRGEEKAKVFIAADGKTMRIETTAQSAVDALKEAKELAGYSDDMAAIFEDSLISKEAEKLITSITHRHLDVA